MILEILSVGELETNCYILGDEQTKEGIVIDPGGDFELIFKTLQSQKLKTKYIILTHGHIDHILALPKKKEKTGAKVLIHSKDKEMLTSSARNLSIGLGLNFICSEADILLEDGSVIDCGTINLKVLHTPGHSPGGISLLSDEAVFTGDTLFNHSIGRTDFPGCSFEVLIQSIKKKLLTLPDETVVYPGHGPSTTIGEERRFNPFLIESKFV
jgi:hydroxyacylglutathione hydrolase